MTLSPGDRIIAAWAEPARGPGWANDPLWVLVSARDGRLRVDCLQPDEQSAEVLTLYHPAAAMHRAMLAAVLAQTEGK